MRKFSCSINSKMDSINIRILNNCIYKVSKLINMPRSPHRGIPVQSFLYFLRNFRSQRSLKKSRGNSSNSDTIFAQVSRHRHYHPINGTFCRRIGDLSSLAFLCSDTRNKEYHSLLTLLIYRFIFRHYNCCIFCNIYRPI